MKKAPSAQTSFPCSEVCLSAPPPSCRPRAPLDVCAQHRGQFLSPDKCWRPCPCPPSLGATSQRALGPILCVPTLSLGPSPLAGAQLRRGWLVDPLRAPGSSVTGGVGPRRGGPWLGSNRSRPRTRSSSSWPWSGTVPSLVSSFQGAPARSQAGRGVPTQEERRQEAGGGKFEAGARTERRSSGLA